MKYVIVALAALACLALAEQDQNLYLSNVRLTMPEGEPVEETRAVRNDNSLIPVFMNSDNIYNKKADRKMMEDIAKYLKEKGYSSEIGGIGPNYHYSQITRVKEGGIYLVIYGGACAGTLREMWASNHFTSVLKARNAKMVVAFLSPPSTNIHNLKWLPRAHDDNFSPAWFKGVSYPEKKLLDNGFGVVIGKNAKEIADKFPGFKSSAVREEVPPPQNIDISTIITIGKTVWEIIKDGKPVVDYKDDWAGAIPKGVSWTDLEGFKDYRWGPFGWDFNNILGMDNVKFSWNFIWSCKGSYNGHGSFIMNAGASIIEIYAAWGYTVNVNVSVDKTPVNYGTKVDPIAGIAVEVTLDLKSVLQSFTERCRVSLRGDCSAAQVSC